MQLNLTSKVELQATTAGKHGAVSILAYSGGPMVVGGFGEVAIDLDGLKLSGSVPLLIDHDATIASVAGAGMPLVRNGQLFIEGSLAPGAPAAEALRSLAKAGVPLQASVGVAPGDRARLRPGETINVNGRRIKAGPNGLTAILTGRLREVSVLPLGADDQTSVSIAARGVPMSEQVTEQQQVITGDDDSAELTAAEAERRRVVGITTAALQATREWPDRGPEYDRIASELIQGGASVNDARLALLRAGRVEGINFIPRGRPSFGALGQPRDQIAAAALLMANQGEACARHFGERIAHNMPRPSGWPELAAMALAASGQNIPHDRGELLKAAFSTTSMPAALGLAVEKVVLDVFTESSANWRPLARIASASDFKGGKAVRLSAGAAFEKVGPTGEIKHGDLLEDAFDFKVETYARMFGLTRQAIVNDDASVLSDLPLVLGSEGARSVSDLFFDVLTNAGGFFDGSNTVGAGSELSIDGLSMAVEKLRRMKDRDGRLIGMRPMTLAVPAALESTARQVLNSTMVARDQSADNQATASPFAGLNLSLVVEPRLDDDDPDQWYLFAEARHAPLIVAFLGGRQSPVVEQSEAPFNTLGVQWRAYLDFGVSLGEKRAVVRASGEPAASG